MHDFGVYLHLSARLESAERVREDERILEKHGDRGGGAERLRGTNWRIKARLRERARRSGVGEGACAVRLNTPAAAVFEVKGDTLNSDNY